MSLAKSLIKKPLKLSWKQIMRWHSIFAGFPLFRIAKKGAPFSGTPEKVRNQKRGSGNCI